MIDDITNAAANMLAGIFNFRRKKPEPAYDPYDYDAVMERRMKLLTEGGWKIWYHTLPAFIGESQQYKYDRVELTRDFENVWVADPNGLHPQTNVAGLYWRPLNNIIDVTPTQLLIEEK